MPLASTVLEKRYMASSGTKGDLPSAQRDPHPTQFRTRPSQAASTNFGGGGKGWEMGESATGLLLVASDLTPIYANAEAIQILAYPEISKPMGSLDGFLARKIRSVLIVNENDAQPEFATEFVSGRRRYVCRAFSLDRSTPDHPA